MTWYRSGRGNEKIKQLGSTGSQSITLPVKASEHLKFEFELYHLYGSGDFCFFADIWSGTGWLVHTRQWDIGYRYSNSSGSEIYSITPYTKKIVEITTYDGTLIVDGVVKTTGHTVSYTSGENIKMFGMNSSNSCCATVGTTKIYKDNVLYMCLVPMKDETTGAGYYYDTINRQSYYSTTNSPLIYAEM